MANDFDFDETLPGMRSGMSVFDRFKLNRVVGRGGMGVIWLAEDTKLNRQVALKFLPEIVRLDPDAFEDLKAETNRCLDLTHPHIIRIYDFVNDDRSAAISMEFVNGASLKEARAQKPNGVFDADGALPILEQMTDALRYAHTVAKIVHRDIKPGNVLLSQDGVVKVADFGVSRSMSDSVNRVSAVSDTGGTIAYMSPQQAFGNPPAPSDDIYSVGAMFYELLTSKPPFYRGSIATQLQEVVPPSLRDRRAELGVSGEPIPESWEYAIARALSKNPADRPESVTALLEEVKSTARRSQVKSVSLSGAGLKTVSTSAAAPVKAKRPKIERSRRAVPVFVPAAAIGLVAALLVLFLIPGTRQKVMDGIAQFTSSRGATAPLPPVIENAPDPKVPFRDLVLSGQYEGQRRSLPGSAVRVLGDVTTTLEPRRDGKLRVIFPDGKAPETLDVQLNLPGFKQARGSFPLTGGTAVQASFGDLSRISAEVKVAAGGELLALSDVARDIQTTLIQGVELEFAGTGEVSIDSWAAGAGGKFTGKDGDSLNLPAGSYKATLRTGCHPPFDAVSLGTLQIGADYPPIELPSLPVGILAGRSDWSARVWDAATSTASYRDGIAEWFVINLAPDGDARLPRVVQVYKEGTPPHEKSIFLPSRITSASFDLGSRVWTLQVDPRPFKEAASQGIKERYYSRLTMRLTPPPKKALHSYEAAIADLPDDRAPQSRDFSLMRLTGTPSGPPIRDEAQFRSYLDGRGLNGWPFDCLFGMQPGIHDSVGGQ